jgi:hypothetical protein
MIAMKMNDRPRRLGIVALLQEQLGDLRADHPVLHVAQQLGVDVVAGGGDEREQRAGEHAGQRQREDDLAERPPNGVEYRSRAASVSRTSIFSRLT